MTPSDQLELRLREVLRCHAPLATPTLDGPALRALAAQRGAASPRQQATARTVVYAVLAAAAVVAVALTVARTVSVAGPHHRHVPAVGPGTSVPSTVEHRPVIESRPIPTVTPSTEPGDTPSTARVTAPAAALTTGP
jgi:hypothetical protein